MRRNSLSFLREEVRRMSPYAVFSSDEGIALQRNEAPTELPDSIRQEILDRVGEKPWRRYPDLGQEKLRASARQALGLPEGLDIVFGNGSNELIGAIVAACIDPQSAAIIPQPTFSMYERTIRLAHGTPILLPPQGSLQFDPGEILEAAQVHNARLVFLCRPNNPTGMSIPLAEVRRMAENLDGLLVVDEAYIEFAEDDALSIAEEYGNVLLLRTFSKAMSGAGLRIGYAIGRTVLIEQLIKTLVPYNLGLMATETVRVTFERHSELQSSHAALIKERERLRAGLSACPGITVLPSQTNFLLLLSEVPGNALAAGLARQGITVRDVSTYPGLSNAIRVTVGTAEENGQLIRALQRELEAQR